MGDCRPVLEGLLTDEDDVLMCGKINWRPRGGLELRLPENIYVGLYPIYVAPRINSRHKLPVSLWPEIAERRKSQSLRQLARGYGVSHEAVRRVLASGINLAQHQFRE